MDLLRHLLALAITASLLSGCATTQKEEDAQVEIDRLILDSARTIQAAQADLYKAAALSKPAATPQRIYSDTQPLSFTWKGDAFLLLQTLAQERGYNFQVEGLRLPLPLNMDVKDQPFAAVLDAVRAQVGYRANVTASLGRITLSYQKPQL